MFISLLCNGVATALIIIAVDFLLCKSLSPDLLYEYKHGAPWLVQVLIFLGIAWALLKQGEAFYTRAMSTPFSIAVAELKLRKQTNVEKSA